MRRFYEYRPSDIFGAFIFGCGFYLLAKLSVSLPGKTGDISYIWLANGFAVGLLMRLKPNHWLPYVITAFIGDVANNLQLDYPWWLTLLYGTIDAAQAPISVGILQVFLPRPMRLDFIRSLLIWCAVSVVAVNGVFSLIGAAIASQALGDDYWMSWRNWFIGGMMGLLTMTPFVVAWTHEKFLVTIQKAKSRKLELAAFIICLIAITWLIFSGSPTAVVLTFNDFSFLVAPLFMWAALRHGFRITTLAIVIWFGISVGFTVSGFGPFAAHRFSPEIAALHLQIYLITISLMALAAAAAVRERERAQRLHLQTVLLGHKTKLRYEAAIRASKSIVYEANLATGESFWEGSLDQFVAKGAKAENTIAAAMQFIHPDDMARVNAYLSNLKASGAKDVSITYRQYDTKGNIHHMHNEGHLVQMPDATTGELQPRMVGFIKDITVTMNAKAENAKLMAQLIQSQKMETMGRLSGGIAHDFNNILTGVLGYSEMALEKVEPASPMAKNLNRIIAAGNRGRALVEQILAFSKPRDDQDGVVAIVPVLEEVRDLIQGSYRHSIELIYENNSSNPSVWANATQLHQLFMNVATNGVQTMGNGGRLSLTITDALIKSTSEATLGNLHQGQYVRVAIADSGEGISDAVKAKMFEPFFTTKKLGAGNGTGLGLALAASVIKRMGGAINVTSQHVTTAEKSQGTVFEIYLPAVGAEDRTGPLIALKSLRGNGELIMVIDDEPVLQEMGCEILTNLGYTVEGFTSSLQALAAFDATPDKYRAIVTDEVMPELTGSDLAARVHATHPQTPVIIITAYGGTGFEFRAEQAGVAKILKKPYHKQEMGQALQDALNVTPQYSNVVQ